MKQELKQYIVIGITNEGNAAVQVTPDTDAATAFQLLGTLTSYLLHAYKDIAVHDIHTEDPDKVSAIVQGITESMYDAVNNILSTVLNEFYPENPALSLEDEAILELVNEKIEARYNEMSDEAKAEYRQAYEQIKAKLQESKSDSENEEGE